MLRVGLIGTTVAAICCFTPLAVTAFSLLGLGAYVGWIDLIVIPVLVIFVLMVLLAVLQRLRAAR